MQNFVQPGKTLTLTAPRTLTSGQAALVGSIFGVACSDVASAAEGEFALEGVFDLPKATGITFSQGAAAYWSDAEYSMVAANSGNSYLVGAAVKAALTGDTTVRVRLNGIGTLT